MRRAPGGRKDVPTFQKFAVRNLTPIQQGQATRTEVRLSAPLPNEYQRPVGNHLHKKRHYPHGGPIDVRVKTYCDLLAQYLGDPGGPPTVDLTRACNLSLSRLRHLFAREMGLSPGRYMHAIRLREARHLLMTTRLTVKEIHWRVGIVDSSHFARHFARMYGVSPTRYRNGCTRGADQD
jgi:AraC-like DNA-binding protein